MPDEQKSSIDFPWCITRGVMGFAIQIGKVIKEDDKTADVLYSVNQCYSPEPWDKRYLSRFQTLNEAVEVFARENEYSLRAVRTLMGYDFPGELKKS